MTNPTPSRPAPGPQLLLVLLIVAACGVVAVSAPGFRLILPPAELSPIWIRAIRIVGGLGALGAILGLHWWSKKGSRRGVGSGDPVALGGADAAAISISPVRPNSTSAGIAISKSKLNWAVVLAM